MRNAKLFGVRDIKFVFFLCVFSTLTQTLMFVFLAERSEVFLVYIFLMS